MRKELSSPGIVHLVLALGGFAIGTTEFATMSLLPYVAHDLQISVPSSRACHKRLRPRRCCRRPADSGALGTIIAQYTSHRAHGFLRARQRPVRGRPELPLDAGFPLSEWPASRRLFWHRHARRSLGCTRKSTRPRCRARPARFDGRDHSWACHSPIGWAKSLAGDGASVSSRRWRWPPRCWWQCLLPKARQDKEASPWRELGALKRGQVWLTLAIGAIGFGGVFAVYTYLASTLMAVTAVPARMVPVVFAAFGVGMTAGNIVVPYFADRAVMRTAGLLLVGSAATLALYPAAAALLDCDVGRDGHRLLWSIGNGSSDASYGCRRRCSKPCGGTQPFCL